MTAATDNEWLLVASDTIDAECPAGGHDAYWTSKLYGSPTGGNYDCRTVTTVLCVTCP